MVRLYESPRSPVQWLVLSWALILVGLMGWIDSITDWEWSLSILYTPPIVIVVWKAGWRWGFAFAALGAVIWWQVQIGDNPYQSDLGFAWAVFVNFFYFVVIVVAVSAVKGQHMLDQEQIRRLEREQVLERDILLASEREQQRIGRDLHDSLGPHLAALGYAATFLAAELRKREQPEAERAEQIHKMVSDAVSLVRDLARGIYPVQMDGMGLSVALEELARNYSFMKNLMVTFQESGDTHIDNPEEGMHLYRIAQEAVNNAAKHGNAKRININLSRTEGSLRLSVSDDGVGMVPRRNPMRGMTGNNGMGMQTMRFRARILSGELQVNSSPNEGTVISCEIASASSIAPTTAL